MAASTPATDHTSKITSRVLVLIITPRVITVVTEFPKLLRKATDPLALHDHAENQTGDKAATLQPQIFGGHSRYLMAREPFFDFFRSASVDVPQNGDGFVRSRGAIEQYFNLERGRERFNFAQYLRFRRGAARLEKEQHEQPTAPNHDVILEHVRKEKQ